MTIRKIFFEVGGYDEVACREQAYQRRAVHLIGGFEATIYRFFKVLTSP
jgi:hypothetical protein